MFDYHKISAFLLSQKRVIVFVICMLVSAIVSVRSGQDANWDLENYHLYNPYAFLTGRMQYDFAPAMLQTYFNPLIDFFNYWLIMHVKPVVAGFILGSIHGINSYLLFLIVEKLVSVMDVSFKKWIILVTCIMGFYGAAMLSEIGTTFGDNIVSLFILAGLYMVMNHVIKERISGNNLISSKVMVGAGLLMGLAVGMKLTTAIYPVAFVLALIWIAGSVKEYIRIAFVYMSAVAFAFVASMGYWMYTLWAHFGNPLFPFFNKFFQSPYNRFINFSDKRFFPKDLLQTLFYPYYFITEQNYTAEVLFSDAHLAVCYSMFIFLLGFICYKKFYKKNTEVFANRNYKMFLFFITFFVLSYIFWQKLFSIYRYILLLEILSPLFVLMILDLLIVNKKRLVILFTAISAITIYSVNELYWIRIGWSDSYFGVEVPAVKNLDSANIVLAGIEPVGYIIPFFPEKTRFLRIEGNFPKLNDTTLYQKELLQHIKNNSYNYLLMHNLDQKTVYTIEEKTGLQVDSATCVDFKTRIETLCLCALVKDSSLIADEADVIKRTAGQNP